MLDVGGAVALRVNVDALSLERGLDTALTTVKVPLLMYCGEEDPW